MTRRGWLALALALPLAASTARAQLVEPPPEADGGDFEVERADSIAADAVEVELGAAGTRRSASRRTRRVRFRGDGLDASVRDGVGDPLAGTSIGVPLARGRVGYGTLGPRWGLGLVLGGGPDPWSAVPDDRGTGARFRGRAGDGLHYERAGAIGVELLGARFARRDVAGGRMAVGPAGFGFLGDRAGQRQGSVALEAGDRAIEWASDAHGGWRAEARAAAPLAGGRIALRARGGHAAFRSLAEPRRSGPARILAASWERGSPALDLAAFGALWAWNPGMGGARGALEVRSRLSHHDALALGFEEQRGTRRLAEGAALARSLPPRQGVWGAWRGGSGGGSLELRHEVWGERLARRAVRMVSGARLEARLEPGLAIAVTHAIYRVQRGESLFLADAEGSRLVFRALTGRGARTRLEAGVPAGGGQVRASLLVTADPSRPRMQWMVEWTRRARAGSRRPRSSARCGRRDACRSHSA